MVMIRAGWMVMVSKDVRSDMPSFITDKLAEYEVDPKLEE